MSAVRSCHYEQSLPWDDQGSRLLTVANYERYTGLIDGLRERIVRERARFIEDYDDNIDQARLDLGRLFRIEDYPSKEALQGKFAIRYRIVPVPDADHFMARLASDDTARVKRDIERQIEDGCTRPWATSTGASAKPSSGSRSACKRARTASRSSSATR